jgi:putative transcriptional regulator
MDYSSGLKSLREEMLLSQMDMAKKLGISYATVNRIENKKTEPSFKTKRKIRALMASRHFEVGETGGK